MSNPVSAAVSGFAYPFRGLKLLTSRPRLWPFAAIPVMVNTLLYALFVWFASTRFGDWLDSLIQPGEAWYWAILYYLIGTVAALVLVIVVGYTFTLVGSLILAPFNEIISEKAEWLHTGFKLEEPFSLQTILSGASRAFVTALKRLGLYGIGFLALLLLWLIPFVGGLLYAAIVPIYSFFFLAWEFFDCPMDRHRFDWPNKRTTAGSNFFQFIGFGAATALFILIPFLALFLIPACVIGATMMFCDLRDKGRLPGLPAKEPVEAVEP